MKTPELMPTTDGTYEPVIEAIEEGFVFVDAGPGELLEPNQHNLGSILCYIFKPKKGVKYPHKRIIRPALGLGGQIIPLDRFDFSDCDYHDTTVLPYLRLPEQKIWKCLDNLDEKAIVKGFGSFHDVRYAAANWKGGIEIAKYYIQTVDFISNFGHALRRNCIIKDSVILGYSSLAELLKGVPGCDNFSLETRNQQLKDFRKQAKQMMRRNKKLHKKK